MSCWKKRWSVCRSKQTIATFADFQLQKQFFMKTEKQIKGRIGEDLAVDYLLSKGYALLERNWTIGHLEVDIIASTADFLVIVEVKTRKSNTFGEPEDFVTTQKQRNLIRAAAAYIRKFGITKEVRFDILSVIIKEGQEGEVHHIPDAFKPRW